MTERGKAWGVGAALLAAAGYLAARRTAHRRGVSTRAWAIGALLPVLLKRGDGVEQLHRAIARARRRGPAGPPRRVRRAHRVTEERLGTHPAFRLRPPDWEPDRGSILYLHGGAYVFPLVAPHWTGIAALAERTGREVAVLLYPLAPEHDARDGVAAARAAFLALAAENGGPAAVAGDSAGGGLALALAHALRDGGGPVPDRLLLFFPWLDVTACDPSQPDLEALDPMLRLAPLREAGGMWAGPLDPSDPRVSPLFGDQRDLPPTLVQVGTHDLLLADARRLAARGEARLSEYPGMFHGWIGAPIPEADVALDEAGRFLNGEAPPTSEAR